MPKIYLDYEYDLKQDILERGSSPWKSIGSFSSYPLIFTGVSYSDQSIPGQNFSNAAQKLTSGAREYLKQSSFLEQCQQQQKPIHFCASKRLSLQRKACDLE